MIVGEPNASSGENRIPIPQRNSLRFPYCLALGMKAESSVFTQSSIAVPVT
jgi:hypothetical protein